MCRVLADYSALSKVLNKWELLKCLPPSPSPSLSLGVGFASSDTDTLLPRDRTA